MEPGQIVGKETFRLYVIEQLKAIQTTLSEIQSNLPDSAAMQAKIDQATADLIEANRQLTAQK